eukprot:TRINITY_DN13178_c0_g1_i1.p1 TRINITY_DN13178_c0_g1~~TRINITY_DN13178_c0_g1_i1.p1  ORF type:complete len:103 (-),score=8.44 TRINITY_DN13178_c0_g1_i1:22-330(-)
MDEFAEELLWQLNYHLGGVAARQIAGVSAGACWYLCKQEQKPHVLVARAPIKTLFLTWLDAGVGMFLANVAGPAVPEDYHFIITIAFLLGALFLLVSRYTNP